MTNEIQEKIMEFERQRQTLMNVSLQRQQLQGNINGLTKSLEELGKTNEEKVYKAAGNILVLRDKNEVKKEIEEQKESSSLRLKTLDAQEKSLVDKLNKLKLEIESQAQASGAISSSESASVKSSKKDSQ